MRTKEQVDAWKKRVVSFNKKIQDAFIEAIQDARDWSDEQNVEAYTILYKVYQEKGLKKE